MRHILIVGGAGYIGSHTAKVLNSEQHNVIIFDNLSTGSKQLARYGNLIIGDLANLENIDTVFQQNNIDAVFHFAASAYVGESVLNPQKYYENNVKNTLNLLNSMLRHNVKKIIFSSTCSVYGLPHYTPIDECHPINPINPYGRSKLMIEQILQDYDNAYGLKYIILRYFNAAGADPEALLGEMHDPETHLIPLAISALKQKNTLKIFGDDYHTPDGSCVRDYIHVSDLANAHLMAYEYLNKHQFSDIFNLGTGVGNSVFEIINSIERISNKKINYKIKTRRQGDPDLLFASSEKANNVLSWIPEYNNIDSIIKTAIQWHAKGA